MIHSCINRKFSSNRKLFLAFFGVSIVCKLCVFEAYSVHCPLCWGERVKPSIKFLKRGFAGKERVNVFQGSCGLYIESKLKSEIFNNKKVCK